MYSRHQCAPPPVIIGLSSMVLVLTGVQEHHSYIVMRLAGLALIGDMARGGFRR
jgi:hypothetical protein